MPRSQILAAFSPGPAFRMRRSRLEHAARLRETSRVRFLSLGEGLEPVGYFVEALFARRLRHPGIHLGVLVSLAVNGGLQIQRGIANGQTGRRIAGGLQIVKM